MPTRHRAGYRKLLEEGSCQPFVKQVLTTANFYKMNRIV